MYTIKCLIASLVAQMVKHLPAVWVTWVHSLYWDDPLEKEMATHSSTFAWKIPVAYQAPQSWGRKESGTTKGTSLSLSLSNI